MTIWTIGHSCAPHERFVELLHAAGIAVLVDVRSVPYSRHAPHASRERLRPALEERGVRYVYLGDCLGGRPSDPGLLRPDGAPDYGKIAQSAGFREGIDRLLDQAAAARTCMMCSEEDPTHCHRTRLIAPVLTEHGMTVIHLRHDGGKQQHQSLF